MASQSGRRDTQGVTGFLYSHGPREEPQLQLIDGRPSSPPPTWSAILACEHRLRWSGRRWAAWRPTHRDDRELDADSTRGFAHETRYLEELRAEGLRIHTVDRTTSRSRRGARQLGGRGRDDRRHGDGRGRHLPGHVLRRPWLGYADFLLRGDRADATLGPVPYEVADTKLARHVKASAILQVCSYVEQLTRVQGVEPEDAARRARRQRPRDASTLPGHDYMAYFRRRQGRFEAAVLDGRRPATRPRPPTRSRSTIATSAAGRSTARRSAAPTITCRLVAGITARQREASASARSRHRRAARRRRRFRSIPASTARARQPRARPRAGTHPGRGRGRGTAEVRAAAATRPAMPIEPRARPPTSCPTPDARRPVLRPGGRPVRLRRRRRLPVRPAGPASPTLTPQPVPRVLEPRRDRARSPLAGEKAAFEA